MMRSSQKNGMSVKIRKARKTVSEVARTITTEASDWR